VRVSDNDSNRDRLRRGRTDPLWGGRSGLRVRCTWRGRSSCA
jgi:hypothetical protein